MKVVWGLAVGTSSVDKRYSQNNKEMFVYCTEEPYMQECIRDHMALLEFLDKGVRLQKVSPPQLQFTESV